MACVEHPGHRFTGIDLAGDAGKTACVWLTEEPGPDGAPQSLRVGCAESGYTGRSGLGRLVETCSDSTLCAIDSPFGLPRSTLTLLNGQIDTGAAVTPEEYRFRATDRAMRDRLRFLDLSPSFVVSPLRFETVRRTLQLLADAGEQITDARRGRSRFLETNARLAVVELLIRCNPTWGLTAERQWLADYRRTEKKNRDIAAEARRAILYRLGHAINTHVGRGFLKFPDWRGVAGAPATFDALFCAFTAYAESTGTSLSYPAAWQHPAEVAAAEGWVFVPDWLALFRMLGKARS